MTGVFVEPELENRVGSVPRDVGHEGKLIGGVGLHSVGASGRFQPFGGWASYRSVSPERMDRGTGTLIIGGQHKPALAVSGQKGGRGLRRYRPALRQPAGVWVDAEAGYPWHSAMPDVEHLPVRAYGQRGRPTQHRHLALWRQLTGLGIHSQNPYLVIVLEGNIHVVWHGSTSSTCAYASCCLSHRTPLTAGSVQPAPSTPPHSVSLPPCPRRASALPIRSQAIQPPRVSIEEFGCRGR